MSSRAERSVAKDLEDIHLFPMLCVTEILPPYGRLDDKWNRDKIKRKFKNSVGLCVLCGAKKEIRNGKQEHLEQDPEHRDYRTYRHRHHLRGDFVHGRVNNKRAQNGWVALSLFGKSLVKSRRSTGNQTWEQSVTSGASRRGDE